MAWVEKGPSGTYIGRGRDKYQIGFEFDTKVPIEPENADPQDLPAARKENHERAQESATIMERWVRGKIPKEEFLAKMGYVADRVTGQATKTAISLYLVRWLWEWCVRNRLHHSKVLKLCRLFNSLLDNLGGLAHKDAKTLNAKHLGNFIFTRRAEGYSPAVINDDINYLKTMARDLERLTGINVAELLEVEAQETQERLPYKWSEILRIFEALDSLGQLGREWKTLLMIMLYTGLRPCDAALVTRKQIDIEMQLILVDPSKVRRYKNGKSPPKPLHDALFVYLDDLLKRFPLEPDEFLCLNCANRSTKSITYSFNQILKAAGVSQSVIKTDYLQGKFSQKTLYSFRHTFNLLMTAVGADRKERKTEMGQKTDEAQGYYEHDQEPEVIATRRKLLNLLPRVPISVGDDTRISEKT